jgi:hypothetical protein
MVKTARNAPHDRAARIHGALPSSQRTASMGCGSKYFGRQIATD